MYDLISTAEYKHLPGVVWPPLWINRTNISSHLQTFEGLTRINKQSPALKC